MKHVRASLTLKISRFDIKEGAEALENFYNEIVLECIPFCKQQVEISNLKNFDILNDDICVVITFENTEDMKVVCQALLTKRKAFESKYPGMIFDVSMTVNNMSETFSFNNDMLIWNCLNVLAKDQESLRRRIDTLDESFVCQNRLNMAIVPDKEKLQNILLGFNPESDKWN